MTNTTTKLFLFNLDTFCFSDKKEQEFKKKVVSAVENDDGKFTSAEIRDLFVEAAGMGLTQVVNLLLMANKNLIDVVDLRGTTALINASHEGREETIAYLLTVGADVNKADTYEITPLYSAVFHGYELIVKQLLSAKADVNKA